MALKPSNPEKSRQSKLTVNSDIHCQYGVLLGKIYQSRSIKLNHERQLLKILRSLYTLFTNISLSRLIFLFLAMPAASTCGVVADQALIIIRT